MGQLGVLVVQKSANVCTREGEQLRKFRGVILARISASLSTPTYHHRSGECAS
jgi:hypothetical protein